MKGGSSGVVLLAEGAGGHQRRSLMDWKVVWPPLFIHLGFLLYQAFPLFALFFFTPFPVFSPVVFRKLRLLKMRGRLSPGLKSSDLDFIRSFLFWTPPLFFTHHCSCPLKSTRSRFNILPTVFGSLNQGKKTHYQTRLWHRKMPRVAENYILTKGT